jgi:hypothetical protein
MLNTVAHRSNRAAAARGIFAPQFYANSTDVSPNAWIDAAEALAPGLNECPLLSDPGGLLSNAQTHLNAGHNYLLEN